MNIKAQVNGNSITVSRDYAAPGDWLTITVTKLDSGDFRITKTLNDR